MQTFLFAILRMVIGQIFTRELMGSVVEHVEFYMNNTEMSNEEKAAIVKENAIAKAKEIGVNLGKSGANLLLETAVSLVKTKMG